MRVESVQVPEQHSGREEGRRGAPGSPGAWRKDLQLLLAGLAMGAGLGIFLFFVIRVGGADRGEAGFLAGRELLDSPAVGAPAPDFELENLSGKRIRLSNLRGKPALINFWATWCGPCRLEMPAIQARYDEHQSELAVLAVNFDEPKDEVQAFAEELGLTFEILLDPGAAVQDLYRVRGYPTTYFVDADGLVQAVHLGGMSERQLEEYLQRLGVGP